MNLRRARITLVLVVLVFGSAITRIEVAAADSEEELALVGAKIYTSPADPPIPIGTILMRGETIKAVGKSGAVLVSARAKEIDCRGLVITAGFQNNHVHFTEPKWDDARDLPAGKLSKQLSDMVTRYGFTTVVDTGSFLSNTLAIRRRIDSNEVVGPYILTAGGPLYPPDGSPYYLHEALPPEILKMLSQPTTPAAAVS